ncbi:tRNA glutamyl-Q(34) synthetase GluQRS [Mariprofundus erugo]|uniref:tRNA glutamyl-Q(34) synthetase GluQRS n=1 Tax=Mariprofundus erugo TaxID=2528639 RepID=A0A5R9GTW7_9PROT|nr:tRNA glutamyl-Q(34) synthetase GluQRS [Mariprofundus erugo]TLS69018.1 tRNA glutamyl-Q(34) synthetase GluQRS [Mariprofundus erugo]
MPCITRFAPSPTGLLHVGNGYAALRCKQWAEQHRATMLLRIEDIDHTRCQPHFADAMLEDLQWLGLSWPEPVRKQSEHLADYQHALTRLRQMGVIYPCFCTRKSIQLELLRMGGAPHREDAASHYPGTCRHIPVTEQERRMATESSFAWRLDINRATAMVGEPVWFDEQGTPQRDTIPHDVVIGRKDIGVSYHLAVVVDDALQGISHVIRGEDLKESTAIHRLLQQLLGYPSPLYIHHPLLKNSAGERLAKRIGSTTLSSLRNMGVCPQRLRHYLLDGCDQLWPFNEGEDAAIIAMLGTPDKR